MTLVALAGIGSTRGSSSHVRWFLVGWLFVLSAVAYLDRINISIAGTAILEEYRFTTTQLASSSAPSWQATPSFRRREAGWQTDLEPGVCSPGV